MSLKAEIQDREPNSKFSSLRTNAIGIYEIGRREENQDFMCPQPLPDYQHVQHTFYMVCDGVGGAAMGHQASKMTCEAFLEFDQIQGIHTTEDILAAIRFAEQRISNFIMTNPTAVGMATTLTFVTFSDGHALLAHAGDSRIYHIRDYKICYQTLDHSLVQGLIEQNIITKEEAYVHPHRNVISKAVMGTHSPVVPDIYTIEDVHEGDYFFLCSDGILESINNDLLEDILKTHGRDSTSIMKAIHHKCIEHSKDNFSAWMVSVLPTKALIEKTQNSESRTRFEQSILFRGFIWLVAMLVLLELLFFLFQAIKT